MLQTLTLPAELAVPAVLAAMPIYPLLPPPPIPTDPAPIPDTGAQEMVRLAPPPRGEQLENSVLVPGAQGPGLALPSNT